MGANMFRIQSLPQILLAGALVAMFAFAAAYVGGYFALGTKGHVTMPDCGQIYPARYYKHHWMTDFYEPMSKLEGWIVGKPLWLCAEEH
jgi:hypothetical protein